MQQQHVKKVAKPTTTFEIGGRVGYALRQTNTKAAAQSNHQLVVRPTVLTY